MTVIQPSTNIINNFFIPILCVLLFIANTSTFLLAGTVAAYYYFFMCKSSGTIDNDKKSLSASFPEYDQQPHYASVRHTFYSNNNTEDSSMTMSDEEPYSISENNEFTIENLSPAFSDSNESFSIPSHDDEDFAKKRLLQQHDLISRELEVGSVHPLDNSNDDDVYNGSMDFEHLLRFPACPTTIPRLDTQFNFKIDHHEIKPHTLLQLSDDVNWSAIHQELEYEQLRHQHNHEDDENESIGFLTTSSSTTSEITSTLLEQHSMNKPYYEENDGLTVAFDDVLLLPPKPTTSHTVFFTKHKFQQAVNKMRPQKKKSADMTTKIIVPKPSTSALIKGKLNKLFTGSHPKKDIIK